MSGELAVMEQPTTASPASRPSSSSGLVNEPGPLPSTVGDAVESTGQSVSHRIALRALYDLLKPRIVLMILITTGMAAIYVTGFDVSALLMLNLLLGTAAVAGSASVLNQCLERDADAKMTRTLGRPLPSGKLTPTSALFYGLAIGLIGTAYLAWMVSPVTASVGLATWVGYVLIYTPMKQRTAWNTTVGAVAGALPMMMGYTATGGSLADPEGWLLVAVLFLWQYPHFMAIAWMYRSQYADAGFKMTPVVEPTGKSAGWQAIVGAIALPIALVALLLPLNYAPFFSILAVLASAGMIRSAFRFKRCPDDANARRLLYSSLIQLPASLAVLIVARLLS